MANTRKLGPVRQLSLQCDNNTSTRPILKKQLSEDISENPIRISLSAKSRVLIQDRPPPLKLAWGEINNENKPNKQNQFTKNSSVINPRVSLWNERDKSKHLNIVLSRVNSEEIIDGKDDVIEDNACNEAVPYATINHQQPIISDDNCYKNIFQKQIRKAPTEEMNATPTYTPTKSNECNKRSDAIVVVPIIERIKPEEEASPPIISNSRPSTAAKKREMFQKRTNSAFNASVRNDYKPPLVRASSVPHNANKSENKSKFVATKRRLKSAKRKDYKSILEDEDKTDTNKRGDIITMVSLISPSGSDNEEEIIENPKVKSSPKKTNLSKKEENAKSFSLRKTVKSVSFQQSSIHAVRSFSASFPSRRSSVATTLLLGNAVKKLNSQKHDKPSLMDEDPIDAKRRLLKSSSVDPISQENKAATENNIKEKGPENLADDAKENIEAVSKTGKESLQSPKEKECWATYCKISEKGVKVSFDTLLRGMLTPTEYRLRRKLSEQRENSQDNC